MLGFVFLKRKKNELKPTAKDEGQFYHFSIVTVRYRQKKTKSPKILHKIIILKQLQTDRRYTHTKYNGERTKTD